jgi:hypothetical protein
MSDVSKAVEAIGLHRRQQTLVLTASKSSARDAHDRADIREVATEYARERFERSVRQTMTNRLDKVLTLRKRTQYFPAPKQLGDSGFGDVCHLAVTVPPSGISRNRGATWGGYAQFSSLSPFTFEKCR